MGNKRPIDAAVTSVTMIHAGAVTLPHQCPRVDFERYVDLAATRVVVEHEAKPNTKEFRKL